MLVVGSGLFFTTKTNDLLPETQHLKALEKMINEIQNIKSQIENAISLVKNNETLEKFRLEFLVKKGKVQELFDRMKEIPKEQKPLIGKELNILRQFAEEHFKNLKEKLDSKVEEKSELDLTLPGRINYTGTYHPINQYLTEIKEIFKSFGFAIAEGPDIEDGYHNFDALNFAPDHPARDMQDTFFIKSDKDLL